MTMWMTIVWLQLAVACQLAAATCDRHVTCPEPCRMVRDSHGCASCDCPSAPTCQDVTCADNEVCQLVPVQCIQAPCPPLPQCVPRTGTRTTRGRAGSPPAGPVSPALCLLSSQAGSCQDSHVRYYYDAGERTCRQFNYSGCLGNDNNFLNFADCMAVCGRSPTTARLQRTAVTAATPDSRFHYCQLDADYGLSCRATNETAWFYNRTSGACETFVFGGCLGNQNRFLSQSICHSVCVLRVTQRPHTWRTTNRRQATAVTPPVTALRRRSTLPPWARSFTSTSATACQVVDCAGKNCSRSGFATDLVGCRLCICADPCEESPCPVNTECVRISAASRATRCRPAGTTPSNVSPSLTSTSRPPGECPQVMCDMFCVTGFVKNENGCDTCQCVDPCQLISCAAGTECVIETLDANRTACVGDMCGLPYSTHCVASTTPLVSTVNRTRDEKFRRCCQREMVNPLCHRLCSRGSLLSFVNDRTLFHCLIHLRGLLACVVDGVDRTQCCASNGVNGHCLDGCSGNVTNFPANPLECQAHMFTFASCYDVPVPPMSPSPEMSSTTVSSTRDQQLTKTSTIVRRTTTVSSARDQQFTSCCVAEGVIPYCYKLCTYNALYDAEDEDLLLCSSSLRRIAACGTNGRNVTQCCASNGLTGDCLGICSGDIANFPADVLQCQQHIDTYALCYGVFQSTTVAPTTPARRCPPTNGCTSFSLRCQYGLARDAAGCEICSCYEPCRDVVCDEGSECRITSRTVCELDMCRLEYSGQCTAVCEPLNCSDPHAVCRYGHVKNSTTGCDTCPCLEPCRNVTCAQGFVCEVNSRRSCQGGTCSNEYYSSCVVNCPIFQCAMEEPCQYGFVRNANGCETCECHDPCQGVTCQAGTTCRPSNIPIIIAENGRMRRTYTHTCTPTRSSPPPPPPPTTTPACRPVRCRMYCRFGWAKDINTGCEICACRDPCRDVTCQSGSVCQPTLQNHTYIGLCVSTPTPPSPNPTASTSPVSTPTVSRTRDEQFRSCCEREVALPVCRRLCSYDSLLSNFDESDFFVCIAHIRSLIGCATNGADRTKCCASSGVSGQCLGVCSGNVTNFPANYLDCLPHLSSFAACYDITLPDDELLPPLECPLVNCAFVEECHYGFAKNEYGCQTCDCYDPCQGVFCESNFRCEAVLRGESYHGVCAAAHPGVNGVIKIDADFSIIDNQQRFKREIEKQISGILKLNDFVFKITGLRRGSIIADFTVSAPANLSDNTAVDLLSHWTYDVKLQYNGGEYTTRLLSHGFTRPTTASPHSSSKNFLLLVVLVPVMVPICLIIVVVVIVLVCKMQKVERSLLSSGSRASSVAGDSLVDDNDKTKGFDNAYCVSMDDNRAGGVSEA